MVRWQDWLFSHMTSDTRDAAASGQIPAREVTRIGWQPGISARVFHSALTKGQDDFLSLYSQSRNFPPALSMAKDQGKPHENLLLSPDFPNLSQCAGVIDCSARDAKHGCDTP